MLGLGVYALWQHIPSNVPTDNQDTRRFIMIKIGNPGKISAKQAFSLELKNLGSSCCLIARAVPGRSMWG